MYLNFLVFLHITYKRFKQEYGRYPEIFQGRDKIGGASQRDKVIEVNQVGNDFVGKPNNGRTKEHRFDCF